MRLRLTLCLALSLLPACGDEEIDLGSLTLEGRDTDDIGDAFAPISAGASEDATGVTVTWTIVVAQIIRARFDGNGALASVEFAFVPNPSFDDFVYFYRLDCVLDPEPCTLISLNFEARSATFEGATLPVGVRDAFPFQAATGPLTLTGTLMWE